MSFPTVQGRGVEGLLMREAQSTLGPRFASSTYRFFLSGTSTPANVYQNGALTTPFPITGLVTSDIFGRFPAIYLDPSVIYRVQFFNNLNVQQWQQDPYISQLSTFGTSALSAFGPKIAVTGEVTVPAPNTGGSGITLTLNSGTLGITPLKVTGTLPGNSAIIINNSATTGAQTATFAANNKPGTPPVTFNVTATVAPSGATYTGGNLTAPFTGTTGGNYTVQLSTGQDIFGVTFTNGSTTFITPSTVISGTPTAALIVQTPVTPAAWLPITCDGVQYYTPIWHGSQPFVPLPGQPPAAVGEVIVAQSVNFGGNGVTTATGGTATPGNWLSPTEVGGGAGFWINITKTGGLSGLAFSAAQGSWVNITSGGLTISSNAQAQITGTYQLSTSSSGSPVVANGTITLSGNNGVQQPTYNGATPLVLDGDGTATLSGAGSSNWFAPTTSNVGSGFYISVSQTGGAGNFTGLSGVTNITNGGLTIGVTGTAGTTFSATGTYNISSDALGANVLGTGTITLTGGSLVQSPNWSGATALNLAGNGAATLNGAATSSWYSPNATNVGSGFWINITRTGGTSGVNFTAAQGSWTNITNTGLTIDISGFTGDVGTATASGTWQISSSASGTPVLGSGSISLSISGLTVTRTYTSGSGAETVPTGSSFLTIVDDGAGAGGAGGTGGGGTLGGGGGGGGRASSVGIAVSAGQTLNYSVAAGGTGVTSGSAGSPAASTVTGNGGLSAVSLTAHSGVGGSGAGGGAGGTASGGNSANLTGQAGTSNTSGIHGNIAGPGGNSAAGASGGTAGSPSASSPGGPGAAPGGGGGGAQSGVLGGAGANGQIQFTYS